MKKIIFFAIIALLLAACKDEISPEKPKNMEFCNARWALYYEVAHTVSSGGAVHVTMICKDTIIANKDGTLSEGCIKNTYPLADAKWSYYDDSKQFILMEFSRNRIPTTLIVSYKVDSLILYEPARYMAESINRYSRGRILNATGIRIEDF